MYQNVLHRMICIAKQVCVLIGGCRRQNTRTNNLIGLIEKGAIHWLNI